MIQILNIKPISSGNLKAFVKIKINDLVIHDFRIIQQEGKKAWVSVPQASWEDNEGKIRYKNLVELPKNLKDEIFRTILDSWELEMNDN